jgi:hypothetical protein
MIPLIDDWTQVTIDHMISAVAAGINGLKKFDPAFEVIGTDNIFFGVILPELDFTAPDLFLIGYISEIKQLLNTSEWEVSSITRVDRE